MSRDNPGGAIPLDQGKEEYMQEFITIGSNGKYGEDYLGGGCQVSNGYK